MTLSNIDVYLLMGIHAKLDVHASNIAEIIRKELLSKEDTMSL